MSQLNVAILDDHQSIIDGYKYRLRDSPHISIVIAANTAEELMALLKKHTVNVLLLDVNVPTAPDNPNPFPFLHAIPQLLNDHPTLNILIVSMYSQRHLVKMAIDAGASGYILKDDVETIQNLESIIKSVAGGSVHFSKKVYQQLMKHHETAPILSSRQLQALALCSAYPNETTTALARQLGVADSTMRNLLSNAYERLEVSSRAAAVDKARYLGLVTPIE